MKTHSAVMLIFMMLSLQNQSQSVFWTETFGTGCNQGQLANGTVATPTNGAWSVSLTGTNDAYAGDWYISSTEAGMPLNTCGDGCINNPALNNRTLHFGYVAIPLISLSADQGATYLEGACGMGYCANANKRAESPVINCTGYSNITLSFDYIQQGTAGSDYTELMFFDGTNWSSLGIIPATNNLSCGGQGYWSHYNIVLPASANNNPNVKIGFRWQNIDDGVATDPSFAVDNISLSVASALNVNITLNTFSTCVNGVITASANTGTSTVTGYTWSSNPPGPVFSLPNASVTAITFPSAGIYSINLLVSNGTSTAASTQTVVVFPNPAITLNTADATSPSCNNGSATVSVSGNPPYSYTWTAPATGSIATNLSGTSGSGTGYTVYVSDANGCVSYQTFTISCITGISLITKSGIVSIFPNPTSNMLNILTDNNDEKIIRITDITGRKVMENKLNDKHIHINISHLNIGSYILEIKTPHGVVKYNLLKE